jgi:hypothetical protein
MSHKIARFSFVLVPSVFVAFCLLALSAPGSAAQDQGATAAKAKADHPSFSVTGCLQKGVEQKGFFIKAEDGKIWELSGRTVKFADHVGQKVTLTGSEVHKSAAAEAKMATSEKAEAAGQAYADMNVTSLKMISNTCDK